MKFASYFLIRLERTALRECNLTVSDATLILITYRQYAKRKSNMGTGLYTNFTQATFKHEGAFSLNRPGWNQTVVLANNN